MNSADEWRVGYLLSMQRALWGMVGSDLRGVAVGWKGPLTARFIFDHPVGEAEKEMASEVETEVIADCWPSESRFVVEYSDAPKLTLQAGEQWWVYLRKEDLGAP